MLILYFRCTYSTTKSKNSHGGWS